MKKNLGSKTYLYPMPVLIIGTYDKNGNADLMNAAWGGIADDNQINICLSPSHKTVKNLKETGAFTVSIADAAHVKECDFVGIVSGNDKADKIAKSGLHLVKSEFVNAPCVEELGMVLECEVISYDDDSCRLLGKIVNVGVEEKLLDESGKIDVKRLDPITYDPVNHDYLRLGESVGKAFQIGKDLK